MNVRIKVSCVIRGKSDRSEVDESSVNTDSITPAKFTGVTG